MMDRRDWRISIGVFLVALVTLTTELVLMRVFDVILFSNIAYMIITGAMFAFGLAGVFAALFPLKPDADVRRPIAVVSAVGAVATVALLPIVNGLPFSFDLIYEQKARQAVYFLLLYAALVLPFFSAGLIFTWVFTAYSSKIRRLYFFDLCGAAVGCVILVPLMRPIGPGGLLFVAGGLGLVASALFTRSKTWAWVACLLAVASVAAPIVRQGSYFDFVEHNRTMKRGVLDARERGDIELTLWDPVSKIDVVRDYHEDGTLWRYHIAYDGGSQSSHMFKFDGDLPGLRSAIEADPAIITEQFWNRGVLASHYLKRDTDAQVAIIGSAAGQETKAALLYNASHVDAVEMVGSVVEVVTSDVYSSFIGDIFHDPRVEVHVDEGRSFIRRTDREYDVIQMFSNHTSSSVAAGTGAMATTYLQTAEAYADFFRKLDDDGVLHINHHTYPKMVATAALAWRNLGREDFQKHVLIFGRDGIDHLPTVLIKMSPWTQEEVATLTEFMTRPVDDPRDTHFVRVNPLDLENSYLSAAFYTGKLPAEIIDNAPYRLQEATDDRPYFNFMRRRVAKLERDDERFVTETVAGRLNSQLQGESFLIPMDVVHFYVTGGAALFFTVLFIALPLMFSKAGRAKWKGKSLGIAYFACLGAGFIIVELTYIQKFMHLVGFPLYTYSVVIFTMLFAAGLGSLSATRLKVEPSGRWWLPFVGTVVLGLGVIFVQPAVTHAFVAQPLGVRSLVTALLIFPPSFFMGMPLPLGILALRDKPAGAIAWAWGMNGLFTVVGGIGAALLSLYMGFTATLLIALAVYILAAVVFAQFRKAADAGVSHVTDDDTQPGDPSAPLAA